jgi:hypothetical protein
MVDVEVLGQIYTGQQTLEFKQTFRAHAWCLLAMLRFLEAPQLRRETLVQAEAAADKQLATAHV